MRRHSAADREPGRVAGAAAIGVVYGGRSALCSNLNFVCSGASLRLLAVRHRPRPYCIRATDPANATQVEYECLGFTLAHEKAVELREAEFKEVVLSLGEGSDGRDR